MYWSAVHEAAQCFKRYHISFTVCNVAPLFIDKTALHMLTQFEMFLLSDLTSWRASNHNIKIFLVMSTT